MTEQPPLQAAHETDRPAPDDFWLQRMVEREMESVAIHGLSREGQEDIGADLVRQHRPDWPDGVVRAFVRPVVINPPRGR